MPTAINVIFIFYPDNCRFSLLWIRLWRVLALDNTLFIRPMKNPIL
ncbi:hypothetical protein GPLA_0647 [Paraglaciecola polaris LMG 21857]|uniref:Uncharacterized protein n=1 Tax=Paraglaciecola polaris LMG 21857 TaxID=1129793 RepID=K6ZRU4_9ALTE|nr:hypothetical protein GPLA_0647 [Paraglaciecola polaris LMG 21857]